MTDWLSEIEQTNKQLRLDLNYTDEMPDEQMARVIRELVRYILVLQRTAEVSLAFLDLSPDAKGLLTEPDGGK